MEFYFLLTATLVLAVLTFLPVLRFEAWWIRLWDFPRLQLAVFIVVLLIVQLTRLDLSEPVSWGLVVIAVACLANQAWWILPYSPFFRKEVVNAKGKRGEALAVMTANVLTPNRNAPALVTLVRQHRPDILVTLESDQWWEDQLRELESDYPHTIKCPLDNLYGMHVYSRLPLQDAETRFMVEDACLRCTPKLCLLQAGRYGFTSCTRRLQARPKMTNPPSGMRSWFWWPERLPMSPARLL